MKKTYILTAVFALLALSLNAQTLYEKVTSTDQLVAGKKVIFVYENGTSSLALGGYTDGGDGTSASVTLNGDMVTVGSDVMAFTLGSTTSYGATYYTFTNPSNGLLGIVYNGGNYYFTTGGNYTTWRINGNASGYYTYNSEYTNYYIRYNTNFGFHVSKSSSSQYAYIYVEASTDPVITATPTSVTFKCQPGESVNQTVVVTGKNLTENITASISGDAAFSVDPTSLGTTGGNLTVTYSPNATGTHTATLTLSSDGAEDVEITLNGTCTQEVTVCDGTGTNAYLPIYGNYNEQFQINQMIYPEITSLVGKTLTSMTFYATGNLSANLENTNWTVRLGTTDQSGYSSYARIDGLTMVAENATVTSGINTFTITFDHPFEYTGGNLVVDFQSTVSSGQYASTYFYGETQSSVYTGIHSRSTSLTTETGAFYSSAYEQAFLPKVTFTYEDNTTPVLTAPENGATVNVGTLEEGGETSVSVTVPVSGRNLTEDVTVNVSGTGFSVTPTTLSAADVNAGTTVTVTYEGTANGTGTLTFSSPELDEDVTVNLTATYISHDPTLTAPVDGSTVEVGTNSGLGVNKNIAVSGNYLTENLTVSVSGTGFRVSPTTLTAADVNAGTTITVTYTGTNPNATGTLTISSGEVSVTVNLTATYSTGIEPVVHGMVRMGTLPIVDQFAEKIPSTNDHPYRYTYFLKLASRDTTSSPARVPVQHTGAELQGYYSQTQMDEDTDPTNFLTTDMLSAEVDMNLSPASAPYFYTINSKLNGVPPTADDYNTYISVLQRREAGDYQEMYKPSNASLTGYTGNIYPSGPYDFFDFRNIRASQSSDSLSYVPIVWTKGIDRHYYTTDSLHNSYGAPLWEVRIGSVNVLTPVYERQAKNANGDWNAFVNWYDEDNNPCSLFILKSLHATGVLPVGNVEYEPYMFRVWLICDGLRNMTTDPNTGKAVNDPDADRTSPRLLYTKYCHGADDLDLIITKDDTNWDNNVIFGGLNTIKPKFLVRFYYVVKGYQKTRGEADSDHVGYVVDEEANPMDPETAVIELSTNGTIVEQTFYNVQGMSSDKPFNGINIVVTRYSDGTVSTSKVIR